MMSATCVPCPPPAPVVDGVRVLGARPVGPRRADEVVAADDLGAREVGVRVRRHRRGVGVQRPRSAQVAVGVVDAGVEHGHASSGAVLAGRLRRRRADVGHGLGEHQLVVNDRADLLHPGPGRELGEPGRVDAHRDRVVGLGDAAEFLAAEGSRRCGEVIVSPIETFLVGVALLLGEERAARLGVVAVRRRDGRGRELHPHLDGALGACEARVDLGGAHGLKQRESVRSDLGHRPVGQRQAGNVCRKYRGADRERQDDRQHRGHSPWHDGGDQGSRLVHSCFSFWDPSG